MDNHKGSTATATSHWCATWLDNRSSGNDGVCVLTLCLAIHRLRLLGTMQRYGDSRPDHEVQEGKS